MAEITKASPVWRRSSYSNAEGACVETRFETAIRLRDSKRPNGPSFSVPATAWSAFTGFLSRA